MLVPYKNQFLCPNYRIMSDFKQESGAAVTPPAAERTPQAETGDSAGGGGSDARPPVPCRRPAGDAGGGGGAAETTRAEKLPGGGGGGEGGGGAPQKEAAQKILAQIESLLNTSGALDEAQFKKINKSYHALGDQAGDELNRSITSALERARGRIHGQVGRRIKQVEQIRAQLEESKQALRGGRLKPALLLGKRIRREMGNIPNLSAEHKKEFTEALRAMQPRIDELKKWERWSTNQAREKLIETVNALKEQPQHPVELARRIREARETWRNWDKIGDAAPAALWDKFNRVCTEVYEPCKAHFEQRAKTVDANAREYEQLCENLEQTFAATEWRKPPWREVDELVHKSFHRRRKLRPLPHKKKKILDQRFAAVTAQFREAMERECERERKRRERAIAAIRALDDGKADLKTALDTVKAEQAQWRPTVRSKPAVENQLWSDFRAVCDAVFDRRKQRQQETRRTEQENLAARNKVCGRIRAILAGGDDGANAARSEVQKIRDTWNELGAVPKKERDAVEKKFRACVRDYEKRLAAIRAAGLRAVDDALEERARLCLALENALGQTAAKTLLKKTRAAWEKCGGEAGAEITARFAAAAARLEEKTAPAGLAGEQQANLAEKQKICLHLEVLAGAESPAEFAAERLRLQAERLSGAMGRKGGGGESPEETFRQLCRRYWNGGAVAAGDGAKLEERFQRARGSYTAATAAGAGS